MVHTGAAAAKALQSCLTPCDPLDGSPLGSSVPGILQTRALEWVALSFSNAWKWKVKGKSLSRVWLFTTPRTAAFQAPLSVGFSRQQYWSGVPLPSPPHWCNFSKVMCRLIRQMVCMVFDWCLVGLWLIWGYCQWSLYAVGYRIGVRKWTHIGIYRWGERRSRRLLNVHKAEGSDKAMATHSSILAWRIPGTGKPGGQQSMGSDRVGHDWATSLSLFTFMHWRRKWQPTPVFLPGESQGQGSLAGSRLWGRTESDTTEAT